MKQQMKTHVLIRYARSHAAEMADLLQRRLETYRILRKLVGKDELKAALDSISQ